MIVDKVDGVDAMDGRSRRQKKTKAPVLYPPLRSAQDLSLFARRTCVHFVRFVWSRPLIPKTAPYHSYLKKSPNQ